MTLPDPNDTGRRVLTWQDAEHLAAEHMRSIGFVDARTTRAGADGGIDVSASDAVAQVKFHAMPVGAPDVQRLRGAAHDVENVLFYSAAGYTPAAVAYADRARVALFGIGPWASISSENALAEQVCDSRTVAEIDEESATLQLSAVRRVTGIQAALGAMLSNVGDLLDASGLNADQQVAILESLDPVHELTGTFWDAVDQLDAAQLDEMSQLLEDAVRNFAVALRVDYDSLPRTLDPSSDEG